MSDLDMDTLENQSDGEEEESFINGKALPNNLHSALKMFPLISEIPASILRKRNREPEHTEIFRSLLFPRPEEELQQSITRWNIADTSNNPPAKKHKIDNSVAQLLNTRLSTMLQTSQVSKARSRCMEHIKIPDEHEVFMPTNMFGVQYLEPYKLYKFQEECVKWAVIKEETEQPPQHFTPHIRGSLLGISMGMGKTMISLTMVARSLQLQRSQNSCTLYICPKNLVSTIYYEAFKFFGKSLKVLIYHRDFQRSQYPIFSAAEICNYDLIITNYETISSRLKTSENHIDHNVRKCAASFCNFNWFRIIIDESHEIRNPSSTRFKSMMKLNGKRRLLLSGTPICNGIIDIFTQMQFVGLKISDELFRRKKRFTKKILGEMKVLDQIRFLEYADTDIKLPTKTTHTLYFDLSPCERRYHNSFIRNAQNIYKSNIEKPIHKNILIQNSILRALQVCSAPYLTTKMSKLPSDNNIDEDGKEIEMKAVPKNSADGWIVDKLGAGGIGSSKMRAFVKLMRDIRYKHKHPKVVVFANFTSTLRLMIEAMCHEDTNFNKKHSFVHGGITNSRRREVLYTKFRMESEVEVLFTTIKMSAVGLNLSEGHIVIFAELWWSWSSINQAQARVYRIGQVKPVDVYMMVAKNTAEERVLRVAMDKKELSEDIRNTASRSNKMTGEVIDMILEDIQIQ